MKQFKWIFILSFCLIIGSILITAGCGGDSTGTTVINNNPTIPPIPEWPSSGPTSTPGPAPTAGPDEQGSLKGYVMARTDGDENSLAMIVSDSLPEIPNYSPVKFANITLSDNPFVDSSSDETGCFTMSEVPYSKIDNIPKVTVTGSTDFLQTSGIYVPIQIEVIVNPPEAPAGVVEARAVPSSATVYAGEVRQFKVYCINSAGELINPNTYTWTVEGGIGVINGHGIFQAGDASGLGTVKVSAGGVEASVEVEVLKDVKPGSITGVVIYSDGVPAAGLNVSVEGLTTFATTDVNGLYTLNEVPPGERTVNVAYPDRTVWTGNTTVNEAGATTLNIQLVPQIVSLEPNSAGAGTVIAINGYSLSAAQGSNIVTINGTVAVVNSWASNKITAVVPRGTVLSGDVFVTVGIEYSNNLPFTVTLPPDVWTDNYRVDKALDNTYVWEPDIAVDSNNNAYAIWVADETAGSGILDVCFAYKPYGEAWSDDVKILDLNSSSFNNIIPSIDVDASGNAYAVWADDSSGDWQVYFSSRPSEGSWGTISRVDDSPSGASKPCIAIDSTGIIHSIWWDARHGGGTNIYYSYRNLSGTWISGERVNPSTLNAVENVDMGVDSSGNVYIVWDDRLNGEFQADIYFTYRSSNTGNWTAPVNISNDSNDEREVSIAVDNLGNACVIWDLYTGTTYHIYSSYLSSGGLWSEIVQVDDISSGALNPNVDIDSSGNAYAVWSDIRTSTPGSGYDIYFSYLPSGGSWSVNQRVDDAETQSSQSEPCIGVDPSGNAHSIWIDSRNGPGDSDIYSSYRPKQ